MAAVSKQRFARSLKTRLNALGCPYTEGAEDAWITELVFKPGEPRIRLLQWLLSKYDLVLGEMVDNSQAAIVGSKMDSRIQRLLFVASNLGLCRYDDIDLIRGKETSAPSSVNKQVAFIDQLLDIILIRDTAEDPMTKSLLSPGIVSESSPLEDQLAADCYYMDAIASLQLPNTMLTSDVDLIPHDIKCLMRKKSSDSPGDTPSIHKLTELCKTTEKNMIHRMDFLKDFQEVKSDQSQSGMQRVNHALDLIFGEVSQLVLSFTYCYENEMLPWCDKSPPHFCQLGPAFKHVHTLTQQFAQMLQGLHQIYHSYQHLSKGVNHKLKTTDSAHSALLAEMGQAAANSFQECVDILETSVQHEHSLLSSTSLCSSTLRL